MAEVIETVVVNPIENILGMAGLMHSVPARFAVISLASSSIIYVAKPDSLFKPDGSMREWVVMNPDDPEASTSPPFWMLGMGIGLMGVLFI